MKRGKKKLTIVNILKKIREKKNTAVLAIIIYLFLDWYSKTIFGIGADGVIDGGPFLWFYSLHLPFLPFIVLPKMNMFWLTRFIHPKKKQNGEVNLNETVKLLKKKHRSRALTR